MNNDDCIQIFVTDSNLEEFPQLEQAFSPTYNKIFSKNYKFLLYIRSDHP